MPIKDCFGEVLLIAFILSSKVGTRDKERSGRRIEPVRDKKSFVISVADHVDRLLN